MGTGILNTDRTGHTFTVRPYVGADRTALEAMYEDFEPKRAAQGLPPDGPGRVREWLDRVLPKGRHLVAEAEGRIVGHVMLVPMEDGGHELANFVHQSVRSRGIGTALNLAAVDVAREMNSPRVWLSVEPSNRAALRSYERAGFRLLPGSNWAPEVEMALELASPEPA